MPGTEQLPDRSPSHIFSSATHRSNVKRSNIELNISGSGPGWTLRTQCGIDGIACAALAYMPVLAPFITHRCNENLRSSASRWSCLEPLCDVINILTHHVRRWHDPTRVLALV